MSHHIMIYFNSAPTERRYPHEKNPQNRRVAPDFIMRIRRPRLDDRLRRQRTDTAERHRTGD